MTEYLKFITGRYVGKAVHIVGSGPSLAGFDYSLLQGKIILAINHASREVPNFDAKIVLDANHITRENPDALRSFPLLCSTHATDDARAIRFRMASHFDDQPGPVYAYGSSGLAAVSIALQGGADRVILWGLDYCFKDGRHHATQDKYTHRQGEGREHVFASQVSKFAVFPAEKIFNASEISALPYFKKLSVADALKY